MARPTSSRCGRRRIPTPAAGEVRIRVRAAGINFADVLARLGLYPDAPKAADGRRLRGRRTTSTPSAADVTGFAEGDRVIALTRFGGYSDVVVVPAAQASRVPDELSDAEAAAVPVTYLTAALALYRMAALTAGETVLVHNAGGGVGIAATQLARLRRATVIGTASALEARRAAQLRRRARDRLPPRERPDEVRKITRGRGVDVILDPIGGASFAASYRMLAPLGRLVMFGLSAAATGRAAQLVDALPRVAGDSDASIRCR